MEISGSRNGDIQRYDVIIPIYLRNAGQWYCIKSLGKTITILLIIIIIITPLCRRIARIKSRKQMHLAGTSSPAIVQLNFRSRRKNTPRPSTRDRGKRQITNFTRADLIVRSALS